MHILIVKLGSIGDIVHTLPVLAAMRRQNLDAEISWAVEQKSAEILRDSPLIDHLIELDTRRLRSGKVVENIVFDATKQVNGLRRQRFDISLDFQGLMKSGLVSRLSGAPKRYGFSRKGLRESAARFFYTDTVETPERIHVIRKNLLLAEGAIEHPLSDEPFEFPIATSAEHQAEADAIAGETGGRRFALLNPAGGWVTKLWPAENFGRLADRLWESLGMVSIVATGPNEAELAGRVAAAGVAGKIVLSRPSLKGFYELAKRAEVYVGGDTGPTHIAIAAGAPVVGLFGPTEWWRNGSTKPDDICIERNDISCRVDCHRRTCSNWICMDTDVETVLTAVGKRLDIAAGVTA